MRKARLIPGIVPGQIVTFSFDEEPVSAFAGESISAALMRAGRDGTRTTTRLAEPRAYYCGMGLCWDCVVHVPGEGSVRGCIFPASEGLRVCSAVARYEDDQ